MWEIRAAEKSHPCGSLVDCNGKANKSAPNNCSCRRSHWKRRNKWETWQRNEKWDEMSMHSGNKSLHKPEVLEGVKLLFWKKAQGVSIFHFLTLSSFPQLGYIHFLLAKCLHSYIWTVRLTIFINLLESLSLHLYVNAFRSLLFTLPGHLPFFLSYLFKIPQVSAHIVLPGDMSAAGAAGAAAARAESDHVKSENQISGLRQHLSKEPISHSVRNTSRG